jgi:hypothetical protein
MYPGRKVEGDSLVMVTDNKEYPSRRRTGIYDKTILCAECDAFMGREYDEYGKKILLDTEPEIFKEVEKGDVLVFQNIDNNKLKLFIVSVLWRCSISNLPELNNIKLPKKFEDCLKNMISNGDAGDHNVFSLLFTRFYYKNKHLAFDKYFQLPVRRRIGQLNYLDLYFPNGYKILVKVDSRPQIEALVPLSIATNRPLYVMRYQQFEKTPEFQKLLDNAYKIKQRDVQ